MPLVRPFGLDLGLNAQDLRTFEAGTADPQLGNASRRQTDGYRIAVVGRPAGNRALHFFRLAHQFARRMRYIQYGAVGLRLCKRLPTDIDALRQLQTIEVNPCPCSDIFRPTSRGTGTILGLMDRDRTFHGFGKGDALDIRDIGSFQPDIHIVRREEAQVPRFERLGRLRAATKGRQGGEKN
ncbi:hypothetical protein D3C85_1389590 [compost metagenome]